MPGPIFHVFFYQVNDILAISTLDNKANDVIIPNGSDYALTQPVLTDLAAATYQGVSMGLSAPTTTAQLAIGSQNTLTFSLTDFNLLRINVADSLIKIDNKIDEILSVATLSCNLVIQ